MRGPSEGKMLGRTAARYGSAASNASQVEGGASITSPGGRSGSSGSAVVLGRLESIGSMGAVGNVEYQPSKRITSAPMPKTCRAPSREPPNHAPIQPSP